MSRVHDALRRAEQGPASSEEASVTPEVEEAAPLQASRVPERPPRSTPEFLTVRPMGTAQPRQSIHPDLLADVVTAPFQPAPESHLLDLNNSHETPAEEFRTLRTRLNHLQTLQPLHTILLTRP